MNQQLQHQPSQQQQQQQQQQAFSQVSGHQYRPDRSSSGATAQETNSHLHQYSLIAEAAKRAELALLEREMAGMEMG
jgi:hypothetical protein